MKKLAEIRARLASKVIFMTQIVIRLLAESAMYINADMIIAGINIKSVVAAGQMEINSLQQYI